MDLRDHSKRSWMVVAVIVSVALFACGGREEAPEQESLASIAPPAPQPRPVPPQPPVAEPEAGPEVIEPPTVVPAPAQPALASEPEAVDVEAEVQEAGSVPESPPLDPSERVFTNSDLEKYKTLKGQFGFRDDTVVVDLTGQQGMAEQEVPDPTSPSSMTPFMLEEEMESIRLEVRQLSADIDYLKKRIPSLHNPFLPRAHVSEADRSAEAGMDNAQKLAHVNARIAEAQSRRSQIQERYAQLQEAVRSDGLQ